MPDRVTANFDSVNNRVELKVSPPAGHTARVDGPIPQVCEPFDPPHWSGSCSCGTMYVGFGEDDAQAWVSRHTSATLAD
jgi:hypothetical protein